MPDNETLTTGLEARRAHREQAASPSLLSDAQGHPSPAGNRDGHAAIAHALGNLGSMARDLTQGRPGDVVSITLDGESLGGVGKMQLRPDALDRLMDGEPNESHEDFTGLDHLVYTGADGRVTHHVHVTYTPQWGGGSVSCRVVACYDAEPAWLATLLGHGPDGSEDESLAPALAASVERTGGAS